MPMKQDKSDEQKNAEAEVQSFKNELGPFVVAADTTRMARVFIDAKQPGNPIIFANSRQPTSPVPRAGPFYHVCGELLN
jgi:hypothetical protein